MTERRRRFSFRLPWLPAGRPIVAKQTPAAPAGQQPPFRPAGSSPAQSLPTWSKDPPSLRIESQPSSPSRASIQSPTSQPTSPTHAANQPQTASQSTSHLASQTEGQTFPVPSSPDLQPTPQSSGSSSPSQTCEDSFSTSHQASPSSAGDKPQIATDSPSWLASHPTGKTDSMPSSKQAATQPQQNAAELPHAQSPLKIVQSPSQERSQLPSSDSSHPLVAAASKENQTVEMFHLSSPKPHQKATLATEMLSQEKKPAKISMQPETAMTKYNAAAAPASVTATVPPQISDRFPTRVADAKLQGESLENARKLEGKQEALELKRAESNKDAAHKETMSRRDTHSTAISSVDMQTKAHPAPQFQAEGRQVENHEPQEKRETFTTSGPNKKQFKTALLTHGRKVLSEPHHKSNTSNNEQAPLQKGIRDDISKFIHKLASGNQNQPLSGKSLCVVTLTGENKGAVMQSSTVPSKREGTIHISRDYKTNLDESIGTTTDGEENSKGRRSKDALTRGSPASVAYMNSNAQSLNNSIILDGSVTEKSPGAKLLISINKIEQKKTDSKTESLRTHKSEFGVTQAQKLTYEPTVRRRCLRGLFMESSDSDTDNPDKPRRHGCRYSCKAKAKDNTKTFFKQEL